MCVTSVFSNYYTVYTFFSFIMKGISKFAFNVNYLIKDGKF